jgi:acetoin utilization protein AcuB
VNQLPVVSGGELVGIITDRDLRDAFPSLTEHVEHPVQAHAQTAGIDVEEVMTRQVLSVAETESVHAAASLLLRERIGALPVLRDKQLVGIVTRSDLLRALISLTTRATL